MPRRAGVAGMLQLTEGLPVVVCSRSLTMVTELSARRIRTPMVLVTDCPMLARQACLLWGITAVLDPSLMPPRPAESADAVAQNAGTATCPRDTNGKNRRTISNRPQVSLPAIPGASGKAKSEAASPATAEPAEQRVWTVLRALGINVSAAIVVDDTREPVVAKYLRSLSHL